MARAKQIIAFGNPLNFGKFKGVIPETIINQGKVDYLAWLYKNKINPFDEQVEAYIKEWAVRHPETWENIKVKAEDPVEIDTSATPTEESEDKIFIKFVGISKERQATWGSW